MMANRALCILCGTELLDGKPLIESDLRKVVEGSLEEAYWEFDAMRKGDGPYKGHPQAERDAYKMSVRGIILKLLEEK